MKKLIAYMLCLALCLSCMPGALAADDAAVRAAGQLYELGLFRGVGTGADGSPVLDLDRAPTRAEAMTMMVRLFMDESAALWDFYDFPFTDVADWARSYVAYAYEYGVTVGQSATCFGSECPVSATEYLTFILRNLGYRSGVDFQWDRAWELSDRLGITDGFGSEIFAHDGVPPVFCLAYFTTMGKSTQAGAKIQLPFCRGRGMIESGNRSERRCFHAL